MDKDIVLGIIRLAYDFWLSTSRKSVKYCGFWFESGHRVITHRDVTDVPTFFVRMLGKLLESLT